MTNPLRRRSDRIESGMMMTLILLFVVAGPLLGWWAGRAGYLAEKRAGEWERDHVHRVEAVLAADPETLGVSASRTTPPRAARATWVAPDGTPRSGIVPVVSAARRGDKMPIWVDDQGAQRPAPLDRDPAAQAFLAAGAVLLGVAAALAGIRAIGRAVLDRRRAAAWQREWQRVGPEWSRDRG